jgi:hypothetical protein
LRAPLASTLSTLINFQVPTNSFWGWLQTWDDPVLMDENIRTDSHAIKAVFLTGTHPSG